MSSAAEQAAETLQPPAADMADVRVIMSVAAEPMSSLAAEQAEETPQPLVVAATDTDTADVRVDVAATTTAASTNTGGILTTAAGTNQA
jgi:hypothetical protein